MIRNILFGICCLVAVSMQAQNSSVSPYSFFGLGEVRAVRTAENNMMGGIGIYTDSIHVSLSNPAAYAKLKLAAYSGAVSHTEYNLKEYTESQNVSVTNIEYVAMGLPLGKGMGMGFGLVPVTSVGYNLITQTTVDDNIIDNSYTGSGNINKLFVAFGYQINKEFSVGASGGFNFGTLKNKRIQGQENVQFGTLDDRSSRINGYDFNFALDYKKDLKNGYTLYSSLRAIAQTNYTSKNTRVIGSFSKNTGVPIETIVVDLRGNQNSEIKVPAAYTAGLGYGKARKWFIGAEYTLQDMGGFSNDFLGISNVSYKEGSKVAVGGFWIPEYNSYDSYLKRVVYRAGLKYNKTGMVVNEKDINDFGITFGLGLPVSNFSNVNVGFELGRKGTSAANLVEENYFKINIGLSLNDKWFVRRRVN